MSTDSETETVTCVSCDHDFPTAVTNDQTTCPFCGTEHERVGWRSADNPIRSELPVSDDTRLLDTTVTWIDDGILTGYSHSSQTTRRIALSTCYYAALYEAADYQRETGNAFGSNSFTDSDGYLGTVSPSTVSTYLSTLHDFGLVNKTDYTALQSIQYLVTPRGCSYITTHGIPDRDEQYTDDLVAKIKCEWGNI